MPRIVSSFCIFCPKFFSSFCFSSQDTNVPSILIGSLGHLKLKGLSLQFLKDPSQSTFVFDGFRLRPDTPPKVSMTVIALFTELQSLQSRVVSSANWLGLNSLWKILIPFISRSCLILHARISTATITE